MKKLLTTAAIALSLSCAAQDTTYYRHHNELYMNIRARIADSTSYNSYKVYRFKTANQRKKDNIFIAAATIVFTGLTVWFWVK